MRFAIRLLATLLLLLYSSPSADVAAAIYKWVDDNGTVTFKDTPPPPGKETTVIEPKYTGIEVDRPMTPEGVLDTLRDKAGEAARFIAGEIKGDQPAVVAPPSPEKRGEKAFPPVELYVTSWCGYCKQARAFLLQRGVPFQEFDIERDQVAARRAAVLNSRGGVPVAVIGGKTLIGFHQPSYERALGL